MEKVLKNFIKAITMFFVLFIFLCCKNNTVFADECFEIYLKNNFQNKIKIVQKDEFYNNNKFLIDKYGFLYERNLDNLKNKESHLFHNNKKNNNNNIINVNTQNNIEDFKKIIFLSSQSSLFINYEENQLIDISKTKLYPYFETEEIESTIKFIKDNISLRRGAHNNYEVICNLQTNNKVEVIGITNNDWYKVKFNNFEGFVPINYTSDKAIPARPQGYEILGNCTSIAEMNKHLARVPLNLVNYIYNNGWKIYLTTEYLAVTEFNGQYMFVSGATIKNSKTIKIWDSEYSILESLSHEIGHALNWIHASSSAGLYSSSAEFIDIYNKEAQASLNLERTSSHTISSHSEYFAECVNQYVINTNNFKNYCPLSYNYVDNIIRNL